MRQFTFLKLLVFTVTLIVIYFTLERTLENAIIQVYMPDFGLYWSAFHAFASKLNPYEPLNLLAVHPGVSGPFVIATVPWAFVLLSPILFFSFKTAAILLIMANLLALWGLYLLVPKLLGIERYNRVAGMVATVCFIPTAHLLLMGQFTLIIAFFTVAFCVSYESNNNKIAGLLAIPLTIKPHLIYLLITAIAYWSIKQRRVNLIIIFFVAALVILAVTWIICPEIYFWWSNLRVSPLIWAGTTLSTPIRLILGGLEGQLPQWPAILMTVITWTACVYWLISCEEFPNVSRSLPWLICVSLLTAPYGWLYDQTLTLFIQIAVVLKATSSSNQRVKLELLGYIVLLQGMSGMLYTYCMNWCFFWFPMAILLIWWRAESLIKTEEKRRDNNIGIWFAGKNRIGLIP